MDDCTFVRIDVSVGTDRPYYIGKRGLRPEGVYVRRGSAEKFKILHLVGDDDLYTNLGLLLSDQCPNTLKIAVFQGESKETFLDRREFTGSVLKQIEDGYAFIQLMNKTKAAFSGLRREDRRDYPDAAIR